MGDRLAAEAPRMSTRALQGDAPGCARPQPGVGSCTQNNRRGPTIQRRQTYRKGRQIVSYRGDFGARELLRWLPVPMNTVQNPWSRAGSNRRELAVKVQVR